MMTHFSLARFSLGPASLAFKLWLLFAFLVGGFNRWFTLFVTTFRAYAVSTTKRARKVGEKSRKAFLRETFGLGVGVRWFS